MATSRIFGGLLSSAATQYRALYAAPSSLCLIRGFGTSNSLQDGAGTVPAGPGTLLQVSTTTSPVNVQARTGVDTAVLNFSGAPGSWTWASSTSSKDGRPIINVAEAANSTAASPLQMTIPDKWVSMDVTTQGQPVEVSKIVEADLSIVSNGGDVNLGQIRAITASVNTVEGFGPKDTPPRNAKCGSVQGSELSGVQVSLFTGTAPITLKRLVGQDVHVSLLDQALQVRALYAERATVDSCGGSIQLGNLDCSIAGQFTSRGGGISVEALDGHAELDSDGGDVEVHLHSKVGLVTVRSGGGQVRVAVSPQASVEVRVKQAASVTGLDTASAQLPAGAKVLPEQEFHFKPDESYHNSNRYGQLSEGKVVVEAGGGGVEIVKMGWREALQQRMTQPK